MMKRRKNNQRICERQSFAWRTGAWVVHTITDVWKGARATYRETVKIQPANQHRRDAATPPHLTNRDIANWPQCQEVGRSDVLAEDAISALVRLGYRRAQAEIAIAQSVLGLDERAGVEQLIKLSLKTLAKQTSQRASAARHLDIKGSN